MARVVRGAIEISTKFLRLALADATLISDLAIYDDIAYAYGMKYCGFTEASYSALPDIDKQLFQTATGMLIVFYWNQSDKFGKKTESHEFGSFEITLDIPDTIKNQFNMLNNMIIAG